MKGTGKIIYSIRFKDTWKSKLSSPCNLIMSNASLIYLLYYCMKVYGFCCMTLLSYKTGYMELFYINDQIFGSLANVEKIWK